MGGYNRRDVLYNGLLQWCTTFLELPVTQRDLQVISVKTRTLIYWQGERVVMGTDTIGVRWG